MMEPGDEIMAGLLAKTGLPPLLDSIAVLAPVAVAFAGIIPGGSMTFIWAGSLPSLATIAIPFLRRPVFVAVTQRELICYRLSRIRNKPVRLMFRAPLTLVRLTGTSRSVLRWRSVRYSRPGAERRMLRLNVYGAWRADLAEAVTALQVGGAAVEASNGSIPLPAASTQKAVSTHESASWVSVDRQDPSACFTGLGSSRSGHSEERGPRICDMKADLLLEHSSRSAFMSLPARATACSERPIRHGRLTRHV